MHGQQNIKIRYRIVFGEPLRKRLSATSYTIYERNMKINLTEIVYKAVYADKIHTCITARNCLSR